ncbi:MAG: MFS transporter [Pacificimonas sp.]
MSQSSSPQPAPGEPAPGRPPSRQPTSRLIAYAGPGVPVAATGLPLIVFLPPFYAGEMGLDLAAVGLMFGTVRAIDTLFDPVVGYWADNTRSRFGRFKPWIALGAILVFLASALLFFPPDDAGLLWLLGGLVVMYAGQSFLNVPHLGWGATISPDYDERSRIYGFWQAGHMVGLIAVLLLPAILSLLMGAEAPPAVTAMGWFILAITPFTVLAALLFVPRSRANLSKARLRWADLQRIFGDPSLRLLLIADISVNLAAGSTGTLFRFFFEGARGFSDIESSLGLLVYFIIGLVMLPLWLRLAKRIGKARTGAFAALYGAIAHVIAFFLFDASRPYVSLAAICMAGVGYAAPLFLLRAMLADHGDVEREAGGIDRSGLLNAVLTTAQKLGYVLPVAVLFPLLALFGYDPAPGAPKDAGAIAALEMLYLLCVPLLLVPAIWLQFRYRADQRRHAASGAAGNPLS